MWLNEDAIAKLKAKFSQKEGNGLLFNHIEISNSVITVIFFYSAGTRSRACARLLTSGTSWPCSMTLNSWSPRAEPDMTAFRSSSPVDRWSYLNCEHCRSRLYFSLSRPWQLETLPEGFQNSNSNSRKLYWISKFQNFKMAGAGKG